MKISIGIVGLPNVGKSTLFNFLTKQQVLAANYPFATIDPNVGVVAVPDERLQKLTELSGSKKTVPAIVEFYDIAGLVKGASEGQGLGNQFLTHIRDVQAILHVVRIFNNRDVIHVEGSVDPLRDIDIIETELILKDLDTVDRALNKTEQEARSGKKEAVQRAVQIKELKRLLESGRFISNKEETRLSFAIICRELGLITGKRQLFLFNGSPEEVTDELLNAVKQRSADYVVADLQTGSGVSEVIRKAYKALNLISFFTTGEDESRAWTIENGTKAPQAAGVIHSDFETKFIRAETIAYEDLISAGGAKQAKQKGLVRTEGKEYIVKDGDVLVIRHS